jgi:lipid II isoglutaminyl synthase (glutamine-hydrolysing)
MHLLSVIVGKSIYAILRWAGKRGSALPGRVIEKIDKNFLARAMKRIPGGVVLVSGTNGKTTTTKMIAGILKQNGRVVLTNSTGSNFTRGIVSTIVHHVPWNGRIDFDIAVIELDEAYAAKFVEQVQPRACVILNIMRDQMDRFGEIDYTAKLVKKVVDKTTACVVLNADDSRVSKMLNEGDERGLFFGVAQDLRHIFKNDDELHSEVVLNESRPVLSSELLHVDEGKISFRLLDKSYESEFRIGGVYNAQNAMAALLVCSKLGLDDEAIVGALSSLKPAFGRGELIHVKTPDLPDKKLLLQLVKNPGGFRQSLLVKDVYKSSEIMIVINDNYADGRDVSWLWDVDFTGLKDARVSVAGVRAHDMAIRLKYDDVEVLDARQSLEEGLKRSLERLPDDETLIVFTTYTAMLKLRSIISKITEVEKV